MHELAEVIERRFPDSHCTYDSSTVVVDLSVDGSAFRARCAMAPIGRVAVQVPNTDGFELALRWTDRTSSHARAASFDDSFLVETNDVQLANAWLDRDVRDWLLASRYVSGSHPERATALLLRDGHWQHEVRGDQVTALRDDAESSPERVADMLQSSLSLATWPMRWARVFAPLAHSLGGEASARVELGGKPILRFRRGSADVHVRLLRRLGPADPGRLRMVVSAHRQASSGETLSLISDDLPRSAWPPPNDTRSSTLRIDPHARKLLDLAHPSTTIVRPHDVEITFDGAAVDEARLGAAIELAAKWAGDGNGTGPYR